MNNSLRSFIVAAFLCVGVFSCKAMEREIGNVFREEKTLSGQIAESLVGVGFALLGKGTVQVFCKLIPVLRPWIDDVQFSLLFSGKGKELKLSSNIFISLMGLYVASKLKNSKQYKPEFLAGLFVVAPLLTTTYQYVTKSRQDTENNNYSQH